MLTIPNPSNQEHKLISKLKELFKNTLEIQRTLKENPDLMIKDDLKSLSEMIDEIQFVGLKVVNDEIQKCH
jgi:hypothetical protein